MRDQIQCGDKTLESYIHELISSTCSLRTAWQSLNLWIIDETTEEQLRGAERVGLELAARKPTIPVFPERLSTYLSAYNKVTNIEDCLNISTSQPEIPINRIDPDKLWIDRVMSHSVELITSGYLSLPLNEGSYDACFHPVFWQNRLLSTPFYCQQKVFQKESKMRGNSKIGSSYRWDGVVYSKKVLGGDQSLVFGLFEVSKPCGIDSPKSKTDWTKLLSGCCAMLSNLKDAVHKDPPTVAELAVIGVLQTGVWTKALVMSCIGRNLYYVTEGGSMVFL